MKRRMLALGLGMALSLALVGCSTVRYLVKGIMGASSEIKQYKKLTRKEAEKLNDDDLTQAVLFRVEAYDKEEFVALSHPQQVMYTVLWYQSEVDNGGLCQYLFNLGHITASSLLDALKEIGANEYHDLLEKFVTKNGIDLNDSDRFYYTEMEVFEREFNEYYEKYPFEEFDTTFYEMEAQESLLPLCAAYIRTHMNDFFQ